MTLVLYKFTDMESMVQFLLSFYTPAYVAHPDAVANICYIFYYTL